MPVTQSEFDAQSPLTPQRASQVVPPQSTPVSVPSATPLVQLVQTPSSHCSLAQSLAALQTLPEPQPPHSAPLQSSSDSVPSRTPLAQEVQTSER